MSSIQRRQHTCKLCNTSGHNRRTCTRNTSRKISKKMYEERINNLENRLNNLSETVYTNSNNIEDLDEKTNNNIQKLENHDEKLSSLQKGLNIIFKIFNDFKNQLLE